MEALYYLLKPIQEEKLTEVLTKYMKRRKQSDGQLLITMKEGTIHLLPTDILYVEAAGRGTLVITTEGKVLECETGIGSSKVRETPCFIACHRSYLVNLHYIKTKYKDHLLLEGRIEIPVSRRMYDEVNQAFIKYYRN